MAKGTGGHYKHPARTQWAVVHTGKDAALADLLRGSGGRFEKHLGGLAAAADPASGAQPTVNLLADEAGAVAEDLAGLLRRAREAGHPAADKLAGLAGQLGVTEVRAEAEPAAREDAGY